MINSYKIKTKFGRFIDLALDSSEKHYVSHDGKIYDIDEDRSVYLIGSYQKFTPKTGWMRDNRRTYWDEKHRVYMGKLAIERALQ